MPLNDYDLPPIPLWQRIFVGVAASGCIAWIIYILWETLRKLSEGN